MQIQLLRHGDASHLLEDYGKKYNSKQFRRLLMEWDDSTLTLTGNKQVEKIVENIGHFSHLFYSPLRRTQQTATAFFDNKSSFSKKQIPGLSEIYIKPPSLPGFIKLSVRCWILLCILKSFYTLAIIRYMKEARLLLNVIAETNENSLIISHQARIITILMYCLLSPKWKVLKINLKTAGSSIIKKIK